MFITFDEGRDGRDGQDCSTSPDPTCHVLTVVVSPWTAPGTRISTPFNHYSLLRTTLELLGVGDVAWFGGDGDEHAGRVQPLTAPRADPSRLVTTSRCPGPLWPWV